MRVLALTDFYPPHAFGGYELQCELQVRALGERGHDLLVLTSRWQIGRGGLPEAGVVRRLHFIHPHNDALKVERAGRDPLRLRRRLRQAQWAVHTRHNRALTRQVIARFAPEVVCVWNLSGVGLGPLLAAQERGIPVLFNLYDYWLADLRAELCLDPSRLKRRVRAVIEGLAGFDDLDLRRLLVCSQAVKDRYVALGFPAHTLTVTPLGLPADVVLSPDALPLVFAPGPDRPRLAYVGRLVADKGVDVAIEAVAHLIQGGPASHACLDIIGGGSDDYAATLSKSVEALGLQGRVRFVGPLTQPEVFSRLTGYDALLFPSRWVEPFGMAVLEAMARGVPVIASRQGGPAEIIADGQDGLLVPPGDPVALAAAVTRLAADPALARAIQRRALETVRARYTIGLVVDQVERRLRQAARWAQEGE